MDGRIVSISDTGSTEMKRQTPCLGFWSSSGKEATVIRLVVQQGEEKETLTLSRGVRGSDIGRMACRMFGYKIFKQKLEGGELAVHQSHSAYVNSIK